jgi:hypothetical protein
MPFYSTLQELSIAGGYTTNDKWKTLLQEMEDCSEKRLSLLKLKDLEDT